MFIKQCCPFGINVSRRHCLTACSLPVSLKKITYFTIIVDNKSGMMAHMLEGVPQSTVDVCTWSLTQWFDLTWHDCNFCRSKHPKVHPPPKCLCVHQHQWLGCSLQKPMIQRPKKWPQRKSKDPKIAPMLASTFCYGCWPFLCSWRCPTFVPHGRECDWNSEDF